MKLVAPCVLACLCGFASAYCTAVAGYCYFVRASEGAFAFATSQPTNLVGRLVRVRRPTTTRYTGYVREKWLQDGPPKSPLSASAARQRVLDAAGTLEDADGTVKVVASLTLADLHRNMSSAKFDWDHPMGCIATSAVIIENRQAGWPWKAVECWRYSGFARPWEFTEGAIDRRGAGWSSVDPDYEIIPVRPLWGGLTANASMHSSVWLAVFVGIGWLRRAVRRARGQCVQCSYDLRGLSQGACCPECGTHSTPIPAILHPQ